MIVGVHSCYCLRQTRESEDETSCVYGKRERKNFAQQTPTIFFVLPFIFSLTPLILMLQQQRMLVLVFAVESFYHTVVFLIIYVRKLYKNSILSFPTPLHRSDLIVREFTPTRMLTLSALFFFIPISQYLRHHTHLTCCPFASF